MKLKSLFLISLLSLLFISGAFAQDRYEYATIITRGYDVAVITSTDFKLFPNAKGADFYKEQLKKVEDLNQEGWEVFNTTTTIVGTYVSYQFFLRKKKN